MPFTPYKPKTEGFKPYSSQGYQSSSPSKASAPTAMSSIGDAVGAVGKFGMDVLRGATQEVSRPVVGIEKGIANVIGKVTGVDNLGEKAFPTGTVEKISSITGDTSQGVGTKVGEGVTTVAELLMVPEVALDKVGLTGLTKMAEKGLLNPKVLSTLQKSITSKFGQFAFKRLNDAVLGGGIQATSNIVNGQPLTKDVGSSAVGMAIAGPVLRGVTKVAGAVLKPLAKPLAKALGLTEDGATNLIKGADDKTLTEILTQKGFGSEAIDTAKAIQDPIAQQFHAGTKTFDSVAKKTESAIGKLETTSRNELKAVKEQIPDFKFSKEEVGSHVNNSLLESLGQVAKSRGLTGFDATKATLKQLEADSLIQPHEEKLLSGMFNHIGNRMDLSARGILNLKEDLYKNYYKEGNQDFTTSNKIVMNIYNKLNNLVTDVHPEIKPALDKASASIKSIEDMKRFFIGKDTVSGEKKLVALAKSMKDPSINKEVLDMLKKLETEAGVSITPDLEGYSNYLKLKTFFGKEPGLLTSPVEAAKYQATKFAASKLPTK